MADPLIVVGLGYVGLPLAVALSKRFEVIGLDRDDGLIAESKEGHNERVKSTGKPFGHLRLGSPAARTTAAPPMSTSSPFRRRSKMPIPPDLGALLAATRTISGLIDPQRRPTMI